MRQIAAVCAGGFPAPNLRDCSGSMKHYPGVSHVWPLFLPFDGPPFDKADVCGGFPTVTPKLRDSPGREVFLHAYQVTPYMVLGTEHNMYLLK